MASRPSDRVYRHVHRLFHIGSIGTRSDAQLLDRFVAQRDEAAEAAFEELVIRHGPMVLRVFRSILHDAHDAEDAFQAVFLVLAHRAGSIRRRGSVASWLFGVAQRVAHRGKRSAVRRQALNQGVGVYVLAFPADGKTLISGSQDRTVRIWNLSTGRPTRILCHDGWVWSLAVSADGSFLAAGIAYPMNLHLWNVQTGERIPSWPIEGTSSDSVNLRGVTLGKDGSSVIVALAHGSFRCWNLSTGKERVIAQPKREKPLDPAGAAALPPVPHTARLAAFSREGSSKAIVRTIPGKPIKLADGHIRYERSSAASTIVWLDSQTGHVRREIEIPQSDVQRRALSPDGQSIAVGFFSTLYPPARGIIRIFRLQDKREIQTIESPCACIDALSFTPDGKQIVAGLQDPSIVIWDVRPLD